MSEPSITSPAERDPQALTDAEWKSLLVWYDDRTRRTTNARKLRLKAAVERILADRLSARPAATQENRLRQVELERDELRARLLREEGRWAEQLAEGASVGDTGICRTCAMPITYETVSEPGYLDRTGWSDGFRRDALICFKAVHYRHVPLVGRERGIWDKATEHAQKAAATTDTAAQRVVEYGLRGADGTIYDGADEGLRWTHADALRAADADPDADQPDVLIRRDVVLPPLPIEGPWCDVDADPGTRTAHHGEG